MAWMSGLAACRSRLAKAALLVLASGLCLAAAPPDTRVIMLPERAGVPSHAVRVLLWQARGAGPHPLLVYQPGWNGSADENSILLRTLAVNGFNVAAFDLATVEPAGFAPIAARLHRSMDLSSFNGMFRTVAEANWRVIVLAQDAIASLSQLPEVKSAPSLAVLGFSFGGAVAAEMSREDPCFAAYVNMDGWLFGPAAQAPGPQPNMLLSGDPYSSRPHIAVGAAATLDEWDAARQRDRLASVGGIYVQVNGMSHEDFTDRNGGNSTIRLLILGFFERELKHEPVALLAREHPMPGVTLTLFTPHPHGE